MTRIPRLVALTLAGALAGACTVGDGLDGEEPADTGAETPDPDGDTPGDDPVPSAQLSGTVVDYATALPVADVTLSSALPAITAMSGADGSYEVNGLPQGELVTFEAVGPAGYVATVTPRLRYDGVAMVYDQHIVADAFVQAQFEATALTPVPESAVVVAELLRGDGSPRDGVLAADIALADELGNPVGEGPYFLGAAGNADPLILQSEIHAGRARLVFLNVPTDAGPLSLTALYPQNDDGQNGGGNALKSAPVRVLPAAATLVNVNDKLDAAGGGGDGGGGGGGGDGSGSGGGGGDGSGSGGGGGDGSGGGGGGA